jgi:Ni,Fe-hydrogenase maturation factor
MSSKAFKTLAQINIDLSNLDEQHEILAKELIRVNNEIQLFQKEKLILLKANPLAVISEGMDLLEATYAKTETMLDRVEEIIKESESS